MTLRYHMHFTLVFLSLWLAIAGKGQTQEPDAKGSFSGQWRTYYQSTFNQSRLKDFLALATGGKVHYQYWFHPKVKVGALLYVSANLGLQDPSAKDEITGKGSRYEKALFNLQNTQDRFLMLLGEGYVQYHSKKHQATLGRMLVSTPFLNPQDGRMIPTLSQGVWYRYNPSALWGMQLGMINALAPRGTAEFYRIGESVGKHSLGRDADGFTSRYARHTQSGFIAAANLEIQPSDRVKVELWNYYADNLFYTLYLKPTFTLGDNRTEIALEWLHQDRVGDGGNRVDSLRYFADAHSNVVGMQFSVKSPDNRVGVGLDYVLPGGRFLFPREWGRESLFVVQKRERSEGTANNLGLLLTYERLFHWKKHQLQTITTLGHQWRPSVYRPADNKYGVPDYSHLNLDFFYQSSPTAQLKPELLITYKLGRGEGLDDPAIVINKVNLLHISMVVNYDF